MVSATSRTPGEGTVGLEPVPTSGQEEGAQTIAYVTNAISADE
jgi:hypothetical protein